MAQYLAENRAVNTANNSPKTSLTLRLPPPGVRLLDLGEGPYNGTDDRSQCRCAGGFLIGRTLAHYQITALLGVGGMGEVYRATDTKLRREVAIKVLPPELVEDPRRLARFKREAHVLASLNHPNIAAIHGLEETDGKPFLVLELVEGEDLSERLLRGAIPVDEALEIAIQIAGALEEAHEKNIVHRDLKPANVLLTPDGRVKVLDFGLATVWSGVAEPSGTGPADSTDLRTGAGTILGTAAYMSPEQARGKPVDKRADVWSFGVLLGEMLTGRRLFGGDSAADLLAAVMTKEPDLGRLPADVPPEVLRLLERCLRKDPRTRWPDIGSARLVLQDRLPGSASDAERPETVVPEVPGTRHRRTLERLVWAGLVLVLTGIASLHLFSRSAETSETRPTAHFVFEMPNGVTLADFDPLDISPDGRSIAFAGVSDDGTAQLWTRSLDAPDVRQLPGTEGGGQPFWSPDGGAIGFFAEGELRRVNLASGTVQTIWAHPHLNRMTSGSWGSEGTILVSRGSDGGLYTVPASGGKATLLTTPDEGRSHWWPHFLPDGQRFLFEIFGLQDRDIGAHPENAGVYLGSPDGPRRLLPVPMRARYGSGHLLFVQDGTTLMAQPFDLERGKLTGDSVALTSSVASGMVPRWGWFAVSSTGILTYAAGITGDVQLVWLDRTGTRLGSMGDPAPYRQIALSPDGSRVAAVVIAGTGLNHIWVVDVDRGMTSRITTGPAGALSPVWSPDGGELAFSRYLSGGGIYRQALSAGATAAKVAEVDVNGVPEDWSPEGLLYRTGGDQSAFWALPLKGNGAPELVLESEFSIQAPRISPGGRWMAYVSDESGRHEIYVEPFRRPGQRVRVSRQGGGQPRWRGDGKELFYLSDDGRLMGVAVLERDSGPAVGMPEALIPAETLRAVVGAPGDDDYAVTPDGQRFLFKTRGLEDERQRIHVITNWTTLLE